jgi:hypothetical protein
MMRPPSISPSIVRYAMRTSYHKNALKQDSKSAGLTRRYAGGDNKAWTFTNWLSK